MTKAPVITAPLILCAYCNRAHGFVRIPMKLLTWKLPSAARVYATGCCIHASLTMMKYPESQDPKKTMNAAHQCPHLLKRFSPNKKRPRNADSRKNEKTPSITNG